MRSKKVTVNGTEYIVSALSVGQVDEIIFASIDTLREGKEVVVAVQGTKRFIRMQTCPAIAASFNNHRMGNGNWFMALDQWTDPNPESKEPWWTPERVYGEFLYEEAVEIYNEIAILSGLRTNVEVVKKDLKAKLGEETAVSAIA